MPNNNNRGGPQPNMPPQMGGTTYVPNQPQGPQPTTMEKMNQFFDQMGKDIVNAFTPNSNEPAKVTSVSLLDEAPQPTSTATYGSSKQKPVKKVVHLTPAKKFLKTTSGSAKPTDAEEKTFANNMVEESIDEFIEALGDSDWKVKARACRGLELCADHFGFEKITPVRSTVQSLTTAPQKSLQLASKSLLDKIASAPTGFSFAQGQSAPVEQAPVNDEIIDFGA